MKIITAEVLGMTEVYKDEFDMTREWHKTELLKIADTAYIRSFITTNKRSKHKTKGMQTIEDLMTKSRRL